MQVKDTCMAKTKHIAEARALRHIYVSLWVCLLLEAGEWFGWFMVVEKQRDVAEGSLVLVQVLQAASLAVELASSLK